LEVDKAHVVFLLGFNKMTSYIGHLTRPLANVNKVTSFWQI